MFKALARDFQGYKNIKYMLLALEILSSHAELFWLQEVESQFKLTLANEAKSVDSYS